MFGSRPCFHGLERSLVLRYGRPWFIGLLLLKYQESPGKHVMLACDSIVRVNIEWNSGVGNECTTSNVGQDKQMKRRQKILVQTRRDAVNSGSNRDGKTQIPCSKHSIHNIHVGYTCPNVWMYTWNSLGGQLETCMMCTMFAWQAVARTCSVQSSLCVHMYNMLTHVSSILRFGISGNWMCSYQAVCWTDSMLDWASFDYS